MRGKRCMQKTPSRNTKKIVVNDLIRNKTGSTDRASNSGHFILALRERTKTLGVVFLPRDAMPARYLLSSVCLSVHHKPVLYIEMTGQIELVFGMEASFHPSVVLQGNSGISKNKGTSVWNFVPNSGLTKFRHGKWIVLSIKLIDGQYINHACLVWSK